MKKPTPRLDEGKREMLKKAAYVVPAVLTLAAAPSFASAGSSSGRKGKSGYAGKSSTGGKTFGLARAAQARRNGG